MDPRNPYAPPVETADRGYAPQPPPAEGGGLSLSGDGWETVASMSKWMRIVAGLQYGLAVLVGLGGLFVGCQAARVGSFAGGKAQALLVFSTLMLLAYTVLLVLGATWLKRAALNFYEGVISDHESPLALGFRNLRLYLILYGIFSVIGLVSQVVRLAL